MTLNLDVHDVSRLGAVLGPEAAEAPREQSFDNLTHLAALICDTPVALISLMDANGLRLKAGVGVRHTVVPPSLPFCTHVLRGEMLVVSDLLRDSRFRSVSLAVHGARARFYAGVPVRDPHAGLLGTMCVLHHQPKQLSPTQEQALRVLAGQVAANVLVERKLDELWHASCHRLQIESSLRVSEASLKEANEKLQRLSQTDPVTGLKNRRAFDEQLLHEWKLSARLRQPFSLVMIDIDRFKTINDRFGHTVGDQVLAQVASLLQHAVRETDMVARFGGEEFAVLLPATSGAQAAILAESIRAKVAAAPLLDETVTVSIGVASALGATNSAGVAAIVARADAALYHAKSSGRNRVESAA